LQATAEFVLPASMTIHEASLKNHLNSRKREMLLELRRLNEELTSVKTDAGLKRWIKEQTLD
jgi:antibiotic biosynthesis monooxygenase (ABM) superfamily enzyme